jgi:putative membrane protein
MWRRLHPLTPFLRSWKFVGAAVAGALGIFRDDLEQLQLVWDALRGQADVSVVLQALAIVATIGVVGVAGAWLSWRATGFSLTRDPSGAVTLALQSGIVVRRRRQVRLTRVQSVDVEQPFVPRLLGLAVVRLEMAAGEDASVALAYLARPEAEALRAEILQFTSVGAAPSRPEADQVLVTVPLDLMLKASLLEGIGAWVGAVAVLLVVVAGVAVFGVDALLPGIGGLLATVVAMVVYLRGRVVAVLRDANFTLVRTTRGLRSSAGLTSTFSRTIDLDRVQGIRVEEPWLWRRFGWARVTLDVAGAVRQGDVAASRNSLVPVARRDDALALVDETLGVGLAYVTVAAAGRHAGLLDPWGYRRLGVGLLPDGAVTRYGRWRRVSGYVPYARIQSVTASQGWLQRRLRLATVSIDVPSGGHRWHAPHRQVDDAARLVRDLAGRALVGRSRPGGTGPARSEAAGTGVARSEAAGTGVARSEPAGGAGHPGPQHEAQHQPAGEPALQVEDGPGQEREPADEQGDDRQRG